MLKNKILKDQRGVALVLEFILVAAVALAIGAVGYRYWQNRHKTVPAPVVTEKKAEPVDPTAKWTAFVSVKGKFSLRYPPSWVLPAHRENCSASLFDRAIYLGPDNKSVLVCASEFFGQVYVSSVDGDHRKENSLDSAVYSDITQTTVSVDGVAGTRTIGTAKHTDQPFAPLAGTKAVTYIFYTNGITYIAHYQQAPQDAAEPNRGNTKNVLGDFDLIVKNTLKFTN